MPVRLTREQVAQLDEEQLEAYARVHLDSERTRRKLQELARGRNHNLWLPATAAVTGVVAVFCFPKILHDPFFLCTLIVTLMIDLHMRTNRRIDAIVTLLELDPIPVKRAAEQVGDGDAEEAV